MSKFAPEQWHERTLQEARLSWQSALLVNVQTTNRIVRYHSALSELCVLLCNGICPKHMPGSAKRIDVILGKIS